MALFESYERRINQINVALNKYGIDKLFCEKISGTKKSRPELDLMLRTVEEGDTIVIESLSRLGRSVKNLAELIELFNEKGTV